MIIIAHRANIAGPNPTTENLPDAVETLLACLPLTHVEVDLWYGGEQFFLGHDQPEHLVSQDWLDTHAPRLWIHAKNPEAAMECLRHGWRCFAHDTDRYVLTSTGQLWTFPDEKTKLTESSVIVMPEWMSETYERNIYGVCTDLVYDLMCTGVTPSAWWRERVNAKLATPVPTEFRGHDPHELEHGRCLAVFHPLKSGDLGQAFVDLQKRMVQEFPDDIHYGFEGEPGWPHWTLTQTKTFAECIQSGISDEEIERTASHLQTMLVGLRTFDILWYGVVPTPTGLIMLGLPTNTDVNHIRESISISKKYQNTIVHASLLRFRDSDPLLDQMRQTKLKALCDTFGQRFFGRTGVDHLNLAKCSWLMSPQQWTPSTRVFQLQQ